MAKRMHYGEGSLYRKRRKNARGKSEEYGNFRIKYRDAQGNEQLIKLETADRNEAEQLYAEWVGRRKRGDDPQLEAGQLVTDFLRAWIDRREEEARTRKNIRTQTAQRYRNILLPVIKYLEESRLQYLTLQELRSKHLNDYLTWRAGQTRFNGKSDVPLEKAGINKEWKIVRSIFRKCFQRRVLAKDVTEGVIPFQVEGKVKRLPKLAEALEVARNVEEEAVRDFIHIGLYLGARAAEMMHLKWENVDFDQGLLHIVPEGDNGWKPKNKSSRRTIPMPEGLTELLKARREKRQHEPSGAYILMMPDGRPFKDYPNFAYRRIGKALRQVNRERKAAKREAIPTFTPHTLRHMFITEALPGRTTR